MLLATGPVGGSSPSDRELPPLFGVSGGSFGAAEINSFLLLLVRHLLLLAMHLLLVVVGRCWKSARSLRSGASYRSVRSDGLCTRSTRPGRTERALEGPRWSDRSARPRRCRAHMWLFRNSPQLVEVGVSVVFCEGGCHVACLLKACLGVLQRSTGGSC